MNEHTPPTPDAAAARYVSGQYAEVHPDWHLGDAAWKAEQVLRVLDLPARDRVVRICEIGCGAGGILLALEATLGQRGVETEMVGYDIAPAAIECACALANDRPNVRFEVQDALALGRLEYDLCLLIDVLEHLEDPRAFLAGLCACGLREYVIHLPLEDNRLARLRGQMDPRTSADGHLHFYDTHSALRLLDDAGLYVAEWVYTPGMDVHFWHHRTWRNTLSYVPKKVLFALWPAFCVHTLGGASLMARCSVRD